MDIGKRLRELREAKGLSQGDIEARTGVPKDRVAKIESGGDILTVPMLQGWANALGIELHEFFAVRDGQPETVALSEKTPGGAQERSLLGLFGQMSAEDRTLLMSLARDLVKKKKGKRR